MNPPHPIPAPEPQPGLAMAQGAAPLSLPGLGARGLAALALAPALAFALMVLAPPLNHDVAAILNFAERWVGGERLYRDLIDVNPPLIFVLTAIPAAMARVRPTRSGGSRATRRRDDRRAN